METITEAEFAEQMSMIREVRKQVEEDLARLDKQLSRADNADTQAEGLVSRLQEDAEKRRRSGHRFIPQSLGDSHIMT